ncbi:beta-glucan synthesis-associated protein-domain-containing protein [Mycena albidolilacea]|uniref:Beta-glucan synthesis-associated protein-domain-containing protein n=1 Tax=Mycena albidolilacea TaxID=1033008 RepID=A0AAD6ZA24_9AGAR|nr:beta-glucan synthesis-associated protein-domain-containing protein [Mycena albidolilacea]
MDDPAVAHTTIGVCLVGGLVSFMLFGVMTTQTYIYYKRFSDDCLKLKALVALMWYDSAHNIDSTERVPVNRTCDSAHTLCVGHLLYVYTIYDNAHTETILGRPAPKSYAITIFLYGVTGAIVQGFFSFRIYAFSKKLYLCIFIYALAVLRMLDCIASLYVGLQMTSLAGYLEQEEWRATAGLTGVISLACFVTMRNNFIWFAAFIVEAKIFSNSLLASHRDEFNSLNSRETLRAINDQNISLSLPRTYIIMNLGLSENFGFINFDHLTFPAVMRVDWVRVYQDPDNVQVGCNPADYPTADYINQYMEAYTNPNLTTWVHDFRQVIPKNRLADTC